MIVRSCQGFFNAIGRTALEPLVKPGARETEPRFERVARGCYLPPKRLSLVFST